MITREINKSFGMFPQPIKMMSDYFPLSKLTRQLTIRKGLLRKHKCITGLAGRLLGDCQVKCAKNQYITADTKIIWFTMNETYMVLETIN